MIFHDSFTKNARNLAFAKEQLSSTEKHHCLEVKHSWFWHREVMWSQRNYITILNTAVRIGKVEMITVGLPGTLDEMAPGTRSAHEQHPP